MPLPGPIAGRVWVACAQCLACTAALWLCGLALAWPQGAAGQQRVVLPTATDLPQALAQAQAQGQPLVVMVSLDNCPYCRQVRQSHLGPLWRSGQAVVQINMQHTETLTDGDGQVRSHAEWVKRRKVSVAPTVLFLGPGGREVADRLEGASLPDFYGAYLDERLAQARQRLAAQPAATGKPVVHTLGMVKNQLGFAP
jgi:Thioredoxin-like